MNIIKQSEATAARRRIYFRLVSTTDGFTPVSGATVTVRVAKNGTDAAGAGTVAQVSAVNQPGLYYYEATAGEVDTLGSFTITPTATGVVTASYEAMIIADDPFASALTAAAIATQVRTELTTELGRVDVAISTRATPAQVNAEVLDVLATDTQAEEAAVPASNAPIMRKLNYLFARLANRRTVTATTETLRNAGNTANISTAALSDDGTTFTKGADV